MTRSPHTYVATQGNTAEPPWIMRVQRVQRVHPGLARVRLSADEVI